MDTIFGVSDKHTGPWIGEEKTPSMALGKGRAMWGNRTVYIAEIRPVKVSDGMPPVAALLGDVREGLVDKHGTGADSMFDDRDVMIGLEKAYELLKDEVDELIDAIHTIEFMVAVQVKAYTGDHTVKVGDFK